MPVKTEEVDDPTTTTHITNGGGKTGGGGEGVAAGHRKSKVKCSETQIFGWSEVRPDGFTNQVQLCNTQPAVITGTLHQFELYCITVICDYTSREEGGWLSAGAHYTVEKL